MAALTASGESQQNDEQVKYIDTRDPLAKFFRNTLHFDWVRLWIVAILYFGIFEKIILPLLGNFLNLNLTIDIGQWVPHVESLMTGFVEFPIFLAIYLWSGRGVVELFDSFQENDSFNDPEGYQKFYGDAVKSFRHIAWPLASLAFALLAVVVMHFVIWGENTPVPPWFGDRLYMRILSLVNIGLVTYCVAQAAIREGLVIYWLRRLWKENEDDLEIHPYHPDGAGGLGTVGQHTVGFLFFVITVMLFILMATIIPSIIDQSSSEEVFSIRLWSPFIVLIWAFYLILVPIMIGLMLWPAHSVMLKKRADSLSKYSNEMDEQLLLATEHTAVSPTKVAEALEKLDVLRKIRSIILEDYPTWPSSIESRRLLGVTSFLPTLYSIVTFIAGFLA
jgi:hypothetical protein